MATPLWVGAGGQVQGTGALSVAWPAGHQAGDLGLLVIESSGNAATLALAGWSPVPLSPVVDVPTAAGSKLQVLWKRATGSTEPAVALPDPGDHAVARLAVLRGCSSQGHPIHAAASSSKTTASTAVTLPEVTTTVAECLVVLVASRANDANGTTTFNSPANPALSGLVERLEAGTNQGNGGGFVIGTGEKTTAGATGTTAMTMTVSTTNACLTLAVARQRRVIHSG